MIEFQCKAYGVDQQRDGICYLLSTDRHRLLLDCGLFDPFELLLDLQKLSESETDHPPTPLDGIICSHAHQDHVHCLMKIHEAYPEVPILASQATATLLSFHWSEEAYSSLSRVLIPLQWRSPYIVDSSLSVELLPAGHLPGAAASLIQYHPHPKAPKDGSEGSSKILYSGDFCLSNSRLTDGLPLQSYRNLAPDFLLIDSTFGNDKSPNRRYQERQIISSIEDSLKDHRNVAIAASPLGQAQELILLLKSHALFSKGAVQVWLDHSIAKACSLFEDILTELPSRVKNFAKTQSLFLESRIEPKIQVFDRKKLLETSNIPAIFISTPQDIQHSLHQVLIGDWHCYWPIINPAHFNENNLDYQEFRQFEHNLITSAKRTAPETDVQVTLYQLQQHSDIQGTLQFIHNLKPQHIAFSHGDRDRLTEVCGLEELINRYHLHLPQKGKTLDILVAKNQLRSEEPSLTEMMLEGELSETLNEIQIRLPDSIKEDNRWDAIADSGIVLATWQGENLVIKGVSQREIINAQWQPKTSEQKICLNCAQYKDFVCQQTASPLFALKVSPEGSCQNFSPKENFQ